MCETTQKDEQAIKKLLFIDIASQAVAKFAETIDDIRFDDNRLQKTICFSILRLMNELSIVKETREYVETTTIKYDVLLDDYLVGLDERQEEIAEALHVSCDWLTASKTDIHLQMTLEYQA